MFTDITEITVNVKGIGLGQGNVNVQIIIIEDTVGKKGQYFLYFNEVHTTYLLQINSYGIQYGVLLTICVL